MGSLGVLEALSLSGLSLEELTLENFGLRHPCVFLAQMSQNCKSLRVIHLLQCGLAESVFEEIGKIETLEELLIGCGEAYHDYYGRYDDEVQGYVAPLKIDRPNLRVKIQFDHNVTVEEEAYDRAIDEAFADGSIYDDDNYW